IKETNETLKHFVDISIKQFEQQHHQFQQQQQFNERFLSSMEQQNVFNERFLNKLGDIEEALKK
ncbi:MAG: hypothetical protein JWR02_1230, partial [Mucilaginibacter sp.]|nr:hypothetical protein [Mucilaginibacter sp.]